MIQFIRSWWLHHPEEFNWTCNMESLHWRPLYCDAFKLVVSGLSILKWKWILPDERVVFSWENEYTQRMESMILVYQYLSLYFLVCVFTANITRWSQNEVLYDLSFIKPAQSAGFSQIKKIPYQVPPTQLGPRKW